MNTIVIFVMLLSIPCISCGARNYYEGFRIQQEMECQKFQSPERDECLRRFAVSYDEYQRQMKEREKDKRKTD